MVRSAAAGRRSTRTSRPRPSRRKTAAWAGDAPRSDPGRRLMLETGIAMHAGHRRFAAAVLLLAALATPRLPAQAATADAVDHSAFRVCADPHNLPFSNDKGEGYENKIAELLAAE